MLRTRSENDLVTVDTFLRIPQAIVETTLEEHAKPSSDHVGPITSSGSIAVLIPRNICTSTPKIGGSHTLLALRLREVTHPQTPTAGHVLVLTKIAVQSSH